MSALRRRREKTNSSSPIAVVIEEILESQQCNLLESSLDEKDALTTFCQVFQAERNFSRRACRHNFAELLHLLKLQRVTGGWLEGMVSNDHVHIALMALRLLLRDEGLQHKFMEGPSPVSALAKALASYTQVHFTSRQDTAVTDILKELTNIFQKLSNSSCYGNSLVNEGVHVTLVQLLSSRELVPLQCALCALINICKSPRFCAVVGDLSCVPVLLHILQHYDVSSRHLASDLLLLLSLTPGGRSQVKNSDSLPLCLRLLHSDDLHTLHRMVGVIEKFAEDSELQDEIRLLGGIPLILALLSKKDANTDLEKLSQDKLLALRAVCCSAVTQLVLNDTNAQHVVQGNGVYLLSSLILPHGESTADSQLQENLQKHALRALRYLFSMERNRQLFKRMFPPNLFELFIDVGHYIRELSAYCPLVHMINTLPESERAVIQANIEATNQNKAPTYTVGNYAVFELLGSGAFGNVYKVKKNQSDVFLAMKEIKATHPCLGTTLAKRNTSIGQLMNEVNIMREQLRHPNVVHYHKCFQEGGHLYIVMELLEGAPLSEHITSLKEKGKHFTEQRIWKIFTQLVLALRYIHKEKHVIHRDLTPANVMLGEGDKLTITDFGLAKQKQKEFSVMKSVVGTMLYWCPELVQNEPYNEKADIWAAGCILYQMATLHPPFHSFNLLALAKKIVEVDYEPVPEGVYSSLVMQVVQRCLTADPEQRPDSVQLGSLLAAPLMQQMDQLALQNEGLEKKLTKEKQRTIRHFHKAVWSEQKYQQLLSSSDSLGNRDHTPLSHKLSSSLPGSHEHTTITNRATGSELAGHNPLSEGKLLPPLHTGSDYLDTGVTHIPHIPMGRREREGQSEGELTDGSMSDTEPLQRSSDNVFVDHTPDETRRLQYHGSSTHPHSPGQQFPSHFGYFADTPPIARRQSKLNPLTSQTNGGIARMRSQSDVVLGREQLSLLQARRGGITGPFAGRSHSAFVSGRRQPLGPIAGGSPSPLSRKSRATSASSVLSISPRHLREISDPITQLMEQLHKLLFLTQLPPSPTPNMRRLLVEQYKHGLFDSPSSPSHLKTEMHRLAMGVSDVVGVLSEGGEWKGRPGGLQLRLLQTALRELAVSSHSHEIINPSDIPDGHQSITYEQLQAIVESLLLENGYYHTVGTQCHHGNKVLPWEQKVTMRTN